MKGMIGFIMIIPFPRFLPITLDKVDCALTSVMLSFILLFSSGETAVVDDDPLNKNRFLPVDGFALLLSSSLTGLDGVTIV